MSIPIAAQSRCGPRDFGSPLPPICNDESFPGPFGSLARSHTFGSLSPSASAVPMSIHGSNPGAGAPPPLPPPRIIPVDGPVDARLEHKYGREHGQEMLSDSFGHSFDRRDRYDQHDDEGYQSIGSIRSPLDLSSPGGNFTSFAKYRPNDGIDNSMLQRLNGMRRFNNQSPPGRAGLSSSAYDLPTSRPVHTQLPQLSLPHRSKPFFDSSAGYTKSPVMMSAVSPRSTPFRHTATSSIDYRSPASTDLGDLERSPNPRSRRTNSGSIHDDTSTQGSYEMSRDEDTDFPMEETSRLRTLNIDDVVREREREYCQAAGQKRRASSPPGDDLPQGPSDQLRRREGLSRGSPVPRLGITGSMSSMSTMSRSGSYTSHTLTASSMTSMGSFGRRSPNALSPGAMSPTEPPSCGSPYATPISLTTSPRASIIRSIPAQQPHQRNISEHTMAGTNRAAASPRKLAEMPKNHAMLSATLKKGRPFLCECCPKKPKKFDTEEELNAHAAEKQYECSFCGNRFKNKNEAERHQNSLHVRRHSWSCSALTGYERAFHDSTTRPGEADVCGYCGNEFNRTGPPGSPNQGRFVSDQDWEERIRHLQDVHKFRECNASKKFFRADHFRQHLKHSHHGSSGKWTNMLENACMLEEDPPVGAR